MLLASREKPFVLCGGAKKSWGSIIILFIAALSGALLWPLTANRGPTRPGKETVITP